MSKEKLGKKDIFAPAVGDQKAERVEEERKAVGEWEKGRENKIRGDREQLRMVEPYRIVNHSFRMREDLVEGLRTYAFFEKTKIYKVINQAVEEFLGRHKPKNRTLPS